MKKSIGALWMQTNEKGEYWTGNIEMPDGTKQNVIVFKNNYKEGNQPDFRIFEKNKKEEQPIMSDDELPF